MRTTLENGRLTIYPEGRIDWQIAGETEAVFWVESEEKRFQLHLVAHPIITGEMRRELLSVSSSGKNAAAVGVMGKLRDIFERAFDATEISGPEGQVTYYLQGLITPEGMEVADPMTLALNMTGSATASSWSMRQYRSTVEKEKTDNAEAQEEWDELEKSIVANIADEVTVAIRGGEVEMTVYKNFN